MVLRPLSQRRICVLSDSFVKTGWWRKIKVQKRRENCWLFLSGNLGTRLVGFSSSLFQLTLQDGGLGRCLPLIVNMPYNACRFKSPGLIHPLGGLIIGGAYIRSGIKICLEMSWHETIKRYTTAKKCTLICTLFANLFITYFCVNYNVLWGHWGVRIWWKIGWERELKYFSR